MAGKGNEAGGRSEEMRAALTHEIDRCLAALQQSDVKANDVAGIDRQLRCVANLARAEKAARTLVEKMHTDEAEMSDDDRGHEPDDPEELERLHHELRRRAERVRAALEVKRGDGWAYNPRVEADDRGDAGTTAASDGTG
jgi:hypothetical protein